MTSGTAVQIPGYVAGTWDIDPAHSTVGFAVRHMMVSKVRGYFREFTGEIITAEDPTESSVTATIDLTSIDTRQEQRDAHIRSADFFDVENHPQMTFRSTAVRTDGADWQVEGELTIKGNTKPVVLDLELNGFGPDAYGTGRRRLGGLHRAAHRHQNCREQQDQGDPSLGDRVRRAHGVHRAAGRSRSLVEGSQATPSVLHGSAQEPDVPCLGASGPDGGAAVAGDGGAPAGRWRVRRRRRAQGS